MTRSILTVLALLPILLVAGGIAGNRPPLLDPPGVWVRLKTYLTTHLAETDAASPYPELRPRHYPVSARDLYAALRAALADLGWQITVQDAAQGRVEAVVTSALWRFKDDVSARVVGAEGGAALQVRSRSRIGRGDLAANTRHVLDLYAVLERRLRPDR